MLKLVQAVGPVVLAMGVAVGVVCCTGCRTATTPGEASVRGAIEQYAVDRSDLCARGTGTETTTAAASRHRLPEALVCRTRHDEDVWRPTSTHASTANDVFMLGMFSEDEIDADESPTTQEARQAAKFAPPEGYWRQDIWHQMGHEAKELGGHDFWKGFKTSFWDVENALVLTATMGASIAIRESGVDDAVRRRTNGHRQLGDFDEPLQLLCHPGTHFAAAGVLWLGSALTKDVKEHELARTLTQALAVNGVSTLVLKAAANTRSPDNERFAWPSGHTSSAFTVAAVLNEHYGPWVGVPSLALAGLCGYQRLDSRVHDFSDVVFGGMMGYIIGTSIARDEKAEFPELFGMKVVPFIDPETGASGLALHKRW